MTENHKHHHEHHHEHDSESKSDKHDLERLKILLPHWIEHNQSHAKEFKKWADIAREKSITETAALIEKAIKSMEEADSYLQTALNRVIG